MIKNQDRKGEKDSEVRYHLNYKHEAYYYSTCSYESSVSTLAVKSFCPEPDGQMQKH